MKVKKWLDIWLNEYAKYKVGEKTFNNYEWAKNKIFSMTNSDLQLSDLNEIKCQSILNNMALNGFSKSSINKVKIVLIQSLKKAHTNGYIKLPTTFELYIPKTAHEKKVNPLTIDEQKKLELSCIEDKYGYLIIFLINTGLRRMELLNLKWSDYDKQNSILKIRKSKSLAGIRDVPLIPVARAIIEVQPKYNEYIFNSLKGTPITETILRKTYLRLRKKSGIPELTNHICRHTFATRLLEAGADPKAIACLLGHTSASFMLDRYVQSQNEHLKKQITLLGNDILEQHCSFKREIYALNNNMILTEEKIKAHREPFNQIKLESKKNV